MRIRIVQIKSKICYYIVQKKKWYGWVTFRGLVIEDVYLKSIEDKIFFSSYQKALDFVTQLKKDKESKKFIVMTQYTI